MKTNQELLDFYGVELGKKYKITKNWKSPSNYVGWTFVVMETRESKILYLEIEQYEFDLDKLSGLDYEEVKPEPLTDEEKKYLSAVIKPFRDSIITIAKNEFFDNQACIYIEYRRNDGEEDRTYMPIFNNNDFYLGMERNKNYTLEELGL